MGSNAIIAIVVGAIVVIVGFSLWPVLNGASNNLYSYFRDSCDDGAGNRFLRAYLGDSAATMPATPDDNTYYFNVGQHGGKGATLSASSGACTATLTATAIRADDYKTAIYDEQGNQVGTVIGDGVTPSATAVGGSMTFTTVSPFQWIAVADILKRFGGINNLLLTIIPVISIAGFLGISGARLYAYGKGASNIGSAISGSIFVLIAIVVAMVIAGPIMGSLVDANQVVSSGQYQVNNSFGNIISLLFAMIPIIYVAGLVTLVGLQARSALMGGNKGGGGDMGM